MEFAKAPGGGGTNTMGVGAGEGHTGAGVGSGGLMTAGLKAGGCPITAAPLLEEARIGPIFVVLS